MERTLESLNTDIDIMVYLAEKMLDQLTEARQTIVDAQMELFEIDQQRGE